MAHGCRSFSTGTKTETTFAYSRALEVGDFILVSNTAGIDYATMTYPKEPAAQAEQAFANVKLALAEFGADLSDVVRVRMFVPKPEHLPVVQPVVFKHFNGIKPANTTVCCPLAYDDLYFEMEVTAYRPKPAAL